MLLNFKILFTVLILSSVAVAQNIITVTDETILPGQTYNMTSDNIYLLDGFVFVEDGSVLNIQEGTVIKGKESPTTGQNSSALIIARGGQIFAEGTAVNPIIFTAESDDVNDPNDLTYQDRGLWGGVILLGRSVLNSASGIGQIEGIPSNEPRGTFGGGTTPILNDNSGTMRYVSIRHGGSEIGAGNEINGLTLGAVGSETTIEYIEVFSNLDDGYEMFGGTVNTKYLVAAFCGDEAFDYDEGWTGKNQFWFAILGTDEAGRIGEHDGGPTGCIDCQPYAIPVIYNATYIGPGLSAFPQGDGAQALIFRDNAGGKYYNSIITEYNGANGGDAVTVQDAASGEDSRARMESGDLVLHNNIWWQFASGNTLETMIPQDFVRTHFTANNNEIVDPQINSIGRDHNGNLDPRPNSSGPAGNGAVTPTDPFFTPTSYYGAFDPNAPLWINGWTALSQTGVTSVRDFDLVDGLIPFDYTLTQNYPNPFNPSTKIKFGIPNAGNVKLAVYNILGEEIEVLVNEFKNAGTYELTWDASNLPSGVYVYTIQSDNTFMSKKMTLLK
jgi:hypothetical protein